MKPAILFDQDGTLLDSGPGIKHTAIKTLQALSLPTKKYEELNYFIGPPLADCFRLSGVPEPLLDKAIDLYRKFYKEDGMYVAAIYDGIVNLLSTLKKEGYRIYVCTSKAKVLSIEILRHFRLYDLFDGIYGASLDGSLALKKDIIHRCLEKEQLESAIMVGDTYLDLVGAKENQILAIAVSYGYGLREEFEEYHPLGIASTPKEIYKIIQGI